MNKCRSIYDSGSVCGEAPLWIPEEHRLYWVDTDRPQCFILESDANHFLKIETQGLFQTIARAKIRIDGTPSGDRVFIGVLKDRAVLCDGNFGVLKDLGSPLTAATHLLFNDGTAGPDGCLYFGFYNSEDLYSREGGIIRINRDLSMEIVADNLALPNGMAFSSDGTVLYVTEMFANRILAYDFDKQLSSLSRRRVFVEVSEDDGMPDGLIIDSEGFLWSAHWQGYRLTRYDPNGSVERVIPVPVPTPTCMAFGGREMTTLYITSAKKGLSEQQLEAYPESGNLFMVETDIRGREEFEFFGDMQGTL